MSAPRAPRPAPAAPTGPETFEPRIAAFVCRWCTYAGADLAGMSRMPWAPEVRPLMLPCSGRVDITLVLRAFLAGADGVLVSGCHPGDCHYTAGNFRARRRWTLFRDLLDALGFDLRRLEFAWISAAEGARWVETVQGFTARVRSLGPYTSLREVLDARETGPAPTLPADPLPHPAEGPPPDERLGQALQDALEGGAVQAVVGWRRSRTLGRSTPGWTDRPEEARDLAFPGGTGNPGRLVAAERALRHAGRVGVVARPAEVAALNVLASESQVDPDRLLLFLVDPEGAYVGTHTLEEATRRGLQPAKGPVGFTEETFRRLDDLMARPPEDRWRFWAAHLQRCVRCQACKAACPLCRCTVCLAEKNQPQAIPTASDGPGVLLWQVVRAFHLAGRCVGCGSCQDACPAGIPLNLLGAALARSAHRNFGHRAGVDPAALPLQADFRPDDPAPFIS